MFPVYKNKEYKQGKTDVPVWDKAAAFPAYIPLSLSLWSDRRIINSVRDQDEMFSTRKTTPL